MNTNHLIAIGALALILTWGVARLFTGPSPEVSARMHQVNGAQARELVETGIVVVDVRSPQEFAAGHLEGAINLPVDELEGRLPELAEHGEVLVYCRSGARSGRAARFLAESGKKVYDLGPMSSY